MASKVDNSEPVMRRLVYNMYRDMLDTYNDKANDMLSRLPPEDVIVDRGIGRQLNSMVKQSGAQSGGAIPPPPPPPPHPSQLSTRLNSEVGPRVVEPPAAIQSAMLKDKKPFTYTPGGLDLSQIRSPRMQRRISRNAHSEGHVGPHVQQAVAPEATHPGEGASLYVPAVGGVNTEQVAVEPPPPPTPPTPPGTQRGQVGAIYVPPVLPSPEVQRAQLNKAPTPWLSQQPRQASTPPWANRGPEDSRPPAAVPAWSPKPPEDAASWVSRAPEEVKTRTIPIHVEGRDTPHGGARIIPIQMEGAEEKRPVNVESRAESSSADMQREKTFPVQSRSFRVLQKITDTDSVAGESQQPWNQQLRKMQLCDDDRALMDKFKAQVDEENFLHCEADPRYRGAAIPSRAFRMLQTMTDGADYVQVMVPHGPPMRTVPRQEQPAPAAELQAQPYIPPSEQQVLEPRKYTGGAIPSRSFRMLQAMTAGPQDSDTTDGRDTPVSISHESGAGLWGQYDPNHPPLPPYWWGYYQPTDFDNAPQYWDPYHAMYAYMAEVNAAYGYPPVPYPAAYPSHPFPGIPKKNSQGGNSDSDGYSSTDEMAFYGANFANRCDRMPYNNVLPTPSIVVTPTPELYDNASSSPRDGRRSESGVNKESYSAKTGCTPENITHEQDDKISSPDNKGDTNGKVVGKTDIAESEESSGSDTEVEDGDETSDRGLQAIRSVSDINIYKNTSSSDIASRCSGEETERDEDTEEEEEEDDDEEEEEKENKDSYGEDEDIIPHQLSVIFEENEMSDAESVRCFRRDVGASVPSEDGDSSTATIDNACEESDGEVDVVDNDNSTVTVRLPLKLKFSRSENDEEVTTVIVGDSQVKRDQEEQDGGEAKVENAKLSPDVSVTISFPSRNATQNIEPGRPCQTPQLNSDSRSNAPSPFTFIDSCSVSRQVSMSDIDCYETAESDSDVSVCLSLPLNKKKSKSICDKQEEDEKLDDSEASHWEDDSSSTSVQTVKLQKELWTSNHLEACTVKQVDESTRQSHSTANVESLTRTDVTSENQLKSNFHSVQQGEDGSASTENKAQDKTKENGGGNDEEECDTSDGEEDEEEESCSSASSSAPSFVGNEENEDKRDRQVDSSDESDDEHVTDTKTPTTKEIDGEDPTELIVSKIYELCTRTDIVKKDVEQKEGGKKVRSSEEESEEDDSGVTSDMSRPLSEADAESLTDVQLTKYQRASTHSRLFKLLQDECGKSDDEEEDGEGDSVKLSSSSDLKSRREHLTLPLNNNNSSDPDSLSSSSGVTSPASPTVTDRLVKELVQSLLQRKKGRRLKKLPLAKLHAAALRILQEDMDPYDTMSSSAGSEDGANNAYHSPVQKRLQHSNVNSTTPPTIYGVSNTAMPAATMYPANNMTQLPPQMYGAPPQVMYGANYYDYCDYYNTWANAGGYICDDYDIMPSRAFKLLREHAQPGGFSPGIINGLWAKCPRIPSSKNIHKELLTMVDEEQVENDVCPPQTLSPTRFT